jgi:hypothetical protein
LHENAGRYADIAGTLHLPADDAAVDPLADPTGSGGLGVATTAGVGPGEGLGGSGGAGARALGASLGLSEEDGVDTSTVFDGRCPDLSHKPQVASALARTDQRTRACPYDCTHARN